MTLPDPTEEDISQEEWDKLGQSLPAGAVWVLKKVIKRTKRMASNPGPDYGPQIAALQDEISKLKNRAQNAKDKLDDHETRITTLEHPVPPPT